MFEPRIRELRETANISQSELARRLKVSRSSVNAWESGLSAPTAAYIVAMAKLFHTTADYILGIECDQTIQLSDYSPEEKQLLYTLLAYMDGKKDKSK